MPQPAAIEQLSAELRRLYAGVWQRIQRAEEQLLHDWPSLHRTERLARLRQLQALVTGLVASADEQALRFTADQLPRAFLLGAVATVTDVAGGTLTGINLDAIAHLAADSYRDLLAATQGVAETTKTLIRTLAHDRIADLLVRGDTAVQAGRTLAAELADQGITAVTYANGARHGLADYADMLARTKSAIAYNEGGFAALAAGGVTYVEVFDGRACGWTSHDDPKKANGTVRPVEEAQAQPISHPRCRRSFAGRPDITTPAEAAAAEPSTTPEQRADAARIEHLQELRVARRAAAKALAAQVDRKTARLLEAGAGRITSPAYARKIAARQAVLDRDARAAARAKRLRRGASRSTQHSG